MNEHISPKEASRILGVSTERVRQFAVAGDLPFITTPLGRVYERGVVERFARRRAAQRQAGPRRR